MTVVVMGAGLIGLATLTWAKAKGATAVVSELAEGRGELARELGADVIVNPRAQNPADRVREMTGHNPDLVFECIGVKGTLGQAIGMVAPRGQVVVVGVCMEPDTIYPMVCVTKELSVQFVLGYDPMEFRQTLDYIAGGDIDVEPLITGEIGIADVPKAFETLGDPEGHAKILVQPALG